MLGDGQLNSFELQQALTNEMRKGERVVWSGQPTARGMRRGSFAIALFGIPFFAFSVFWIVMAGFGTSQATDAPWPVKLFPLFGVPFLLIGAAMLTSPLWAGRVASRTAYAITTERAIILRRKLIGGLNVASYNPELLATVERDERADGTGDLIFENYQRRSGSSMQTVRKGFVGLANVRDVERILHDTLLKSRTRHVDPAD